MKEQIKAALTKWRDTGKGLAMAMILQEQLKESRDANVERVRDMLLQRSVTGFKKYGVTTERKDLDTKQWLQHLQEELLDAAVYVEALKRKIEMVEEIESEWNDAMGDGDASQRRV